MNEQLKPFQQVLVRDNDTCTWACNYYSHYDTYDNLHVCVGGILFSQCIPYEGNEHLLGTTDAPQPKRWRAAIGKTYWFVNNDGECSYISDSHTAYDNNRYSVGNYFRTQEEAQAMADKFKAILKGE